MIYGYFGKVRSGKTISVMREIDIWRRRGYTIYSNIWLSIPHKILTYEMLVECVGTGKPIGKEDNKFLFVDEITLWLDSRRPMRNAILTYFLLQTGKLGNKSDYDYGLILAYTTQYARLIDVRLRLTTDVEVKCKKFRMMNNGRMLTMIFQTITTFDDNGEPDKIINDCFIANKYFNKYNTKEVVSIPESMRKK